MKKRSVRIIIAFFVTTAIVVLSVLVGIAILGSRDRSALTSSASQNDGSTQDTANDDGVGNDIQLTVSPLASPIGDSINKGDDLITAPVASDKPVDAPTNAPAEVQDFSTIDDPTSSPVEANETISTNSSTPSPTPTPTSTTTLAPTSTFTPSPTSAPTFSPKPSPTIDPIVPTALPTGIVDSPSSHPTIAPTATFAFPTVSPIPPTPTSDTSNAKKPSKFDDWTGEWYVQTRNTDATNTYGDDGGHALLFTISENFWAIDGSYGISQSQYTFDEAESTLNWEFDASHGTEGSVTFYDKYKDSGVFYDQHDYTGHIVMVGTIKTYTSVKYMPLRGFRTNTDVPVPTPVTSYVPPPTQAFLGDKWVGRWSDGDRVVAINPKGKVYLDGNYLGHPVWDPTFTTLAWRPRIWSHLSAARMTFSDDLTFSGWIQTSPTSESESFFGKRVSSSSFAVAITKEWAGTWRSRWANDDIVMVIHEDGHATVDGIVLNDYYWGEEQHQLLWTIERGSRSWEGLMYFAANDTVSGYIRPFGFSYSAYPLQGSRTTLDTSVHVVITSPVVTSSEFGSRWSGNWIVQGRNVDGGSTTYGDNGAPEALFTIGDNGSLSIDGRIVPQYNIVVGWSGLRLFWRTQWWGEECESNILVCSDGFATFHGEYTDSSVFYDQVDKTGHNVLVGSMWRDDGAGGFMPLRGFRL